MPRTLPNDRGCAAWALVALVALLMMAGLLVYIDRRFGPEASAFFLGITLGIPLLLVIVVIVGGIYVLVIRGAVHLQERDDAGEIQRMRTLGELARSERTLARRDREAMRGASGQSPGVAPSQRPALPHAAWPDEPWAEEGWARWDDDRTQDGGGSYRILE